MNDTSASDGFLDRTSLVLAGLLMAAASAGLSPGQDARLAAPAKGSPDLRDVVTLMSGKEVRGRVLQRFERDELVVVQGGKRIRIPQRDVRNVVAVNDHLREFYELRDKIGDDPKRGLFLAEWAASKKLLGLARAQALSVVFAHPDFAPARQFLGQRKNPRNKKPKPEWLWPLGRRFVTLAKFDSAHDKWGKALSLTGEHFRVKTNAGMQRAVAMVLDLERLYLFWEKTFGVPLRMREAILPIDVRVWASMFKFPKISAQQLPYHEIAERRISTFFRPDGKRPEQLFGVATQALIYATLVGGRSQFDRAHLCAWAEVGLGRWVESAFGGKPGQAEALPAAVLDPLTASTVFRSQPKLKRLIHLHYELYFELSRMTALRWGVTESFVHYLMSGKPDPKTKAKFMRYLEAVFKKGLGDSSSAFDRAFGEKIEALTPRFRRWLQVRQN